MAINFVKETKKPGIKLIELNDRWRVWERGDDYPKTDYIMRRILHKVTEHLSHRIRSQA